MTSEISIIGIEYDPVRMTGRLIKSGGDSGIWDRFRTRAITEEPEAIVTEKAIELPWPSILNLIREYGSRSQQSSLGFRFKPEGAATDLIAQFVNEIKATRQARDKSHAIFDDTEINDRLTKVGFTRRELKPFQLRDLKLLLALPHGANFSVPGAGKTTVTFALHLLANNLASHLLVIAPKSAFPAWRDVVEDCVAGDQSYPFTMLEGSRHDLDRYLRSGASRFLISYDLAVRHADLLASYLARQPVHLILDEAHRMKAGFASQRGAFLLNVATLPVRRDILTGTPMPQSAADLAAQLAFLWPGQGLDLRITRGSAPREVMQNLYVRTTKQELGIPPAHRHYLQIGMAPGHLALYSVVKKESLRQLLDALKSNAKNQPDFLGARRSVMRLLQISTNPILALQGITREVVGLDSGIVQKVLSEGPSLKMRAIEDHVRQLASTGKKCVVWTIFTDTLLELERMLADLNPVTLYGAVPTGDKEDLGTREGRLFRFHVDAACKVLIANPAAAGEGISLHTVCHDAIYVDRSYVSTHYLQSIDRIHRLGLPEDVETNIYIYQSKAPAGVGSIDYSVSRRLATKIRGLQQLLDDPDLHEVALDEELADDPIEYDVELDDLVDLIAELEGRADEPSYGEQG